MCHKQSRCSMYMTDGKSDVCKNCEYINQIENTAFNCKIGLIVAIVAFIITTSFMYG